MRSWNFPIIFRRLQRSSSKSRKSCNFLWFRGFLNLDEIRLVAAHQITNPDVAVLEFEGTGKAAQTGRSYLQKYITVLTFREGRISHWKDYWNPVNVLTATAESDSAPS